LTAAVFVLMASLPAVAQTNALVFYRSDGLGAVRRINSTGTFTTTQVFNPGSFASGWDQIVSTSNALLFDRNDGLRAVGRISSGGTFTTTQVFAPGAFAGGWTHIVNR
jgi:hypothetical protein